MGRRGVQPRPASERFWEKVSGSDDPKACWLWMGAKTKRSYGKFQAGTRLAPRVVQAARFAYEDRIGPIPEGLDLDHLCRNPPCVNPAHLEPVTNAENQRRARKTHCAQGHLLSGINLYVRPD